jgi:hypothetical protein
MIKNIFTVAPTLLKLSCMAHNGYGLALLGDLENVRPVLLPNRITDDEDNNKKLNRITSSWNKRCHVAKDDVTRSCPNNAKPHVMCWRICRTEWF